MRTYCLAMLGASVLALSLEETVPRGDFDQYWIDLNDDDRAAFRGLGWTQDSWDYGTNFPQSHYLAWD